MKLSLGKIKFMYCFWACSILFLANAVRAQSIYNKYWYSDSAALGLRIQKQRFSLFEDGAGDSLVGVKFRVKGEHLVFKKRYWAGVCNLYMKQRFIIEKLTNDTLVIVPDTTKGKKYLYSILEIDYERIVFTYSPNRQKHPFRKD